MKCIIRSASTTLKPGTVERVPDHVAAKAVAAGTAVYTSKTAWKKQRAEKAAENTSQ